MRTRSPLSHDQVRPLDIRKELEDVAYRLYNGEEHVAGSKSEYKEADRIGGIVESVIGGNVEFIEVPMISWRFRELEVEPRTKYAVVAPYIKSVDVEGRVHHLEGDPSDYRAWRNFPEGRIAVTIPPGNPDDLKYVALHAWETGAEAVIVGTNKPRKIVTTGTWGYSYIVGAPPPIPVIIVDIASARRIAWEGRARIYVNANTMEAKGVNLKLSLPGRDLIGIGSHYDRWYGGFQDNILGIAQSIITAKKLNEKGYAVDLMIFTAEEHGAPGYAGWYWAWGSRWHVKQLQLSDVADDYIMYVNFDVAGNQPLIVSGSPQYAINVLEELKARNIQAYGRKYECPECDSLNFALAGIPTVSIHSLWNDNVRDFYHTPEDTPDNADMNAAAKAVEAVIDVVSRGPDYSRLEMELKDILGDGPLLARNILHILLAVAQTRGWDEVYRWMAKRFLKPVLVGDYRYDYGQDFEAAYFPEVYVLKRITESWPHSVIIPGEERIIYQIKPEGGFKDQVFYTLLDLWERFRDELEWMRK